MFVNHVYTLPFDFLTFFASVASILIGKDEEYEKMAKPMLKFQTRCAMTFKTHFNSGLLANESFRSNWELVWVIGMSNCSSGLCERWETYHLPPSHRLSLWSSSSAPWPARERYRTNLRGTESKKGYSSQTAYDSFKQKTLNSLIKYLVCVFDLA